MNTELLNDYKTIRRAGGFYESGHGLIAVSGKEAAKFLNGLITNDVAKLEENAQMSAAFPNAQGRLLAAVRGLRRGDVFVFQTDGATHEKVFQNLFRFTYAGDFFVEDRTALYKSFEVQNSAFSPQSPEIIAFSSSNGTVYHVPEQSAEAFKSELIEQNAVEISEELYEILRIENGTPLYGVDMDETTIVPELGFPDLISYTKGCYIGQEIIARIHFRGHIAKQLTGLIFEDDAADIKPNDEIKSPEGKNAGKITSVTFSPKLGKPIALAFVRYDYLTEGTQLKVNDFTAKVKTLPFVE
ncbi:MAG: Glycine cleavage system protein [Acidobacteria bacterium]|nr:Glycine cleavage system protein [Acidobacteriota bacterium]